MIHVRRSVDILVKDKGWTSSPSTVVIESVEMKDSTSRRKLETGLSVGMDGGVHDCQKSSTPRYAFADIGTDDAADERQEVPATVPPTHVYATD